MKFVRRYSTADRSVRNQIAWKRITSRVTKADGTVIFEMKNVEVPEAWSQTATDILAQKYLRKAGVPSATQTMMNLDKKYEDEQRLYGMPPLWLWPNQPEADATFGPETSAHQIFHRMAGCWTYWGWKEGYFAHDRKKKLTDAHAIANAQIFYDEAYMMLALQIAAPNSPQWFNTGLHWAYGIEGPDNGQWIIKDGVAEQIQTSYVHPQPHACFIQPVADDLVGDGGIMDLFRKEVRLFKLGSGTGTNFSNIRAKGEKLSGGGVSSGLMSFLRIGDSAAGAIKSGGTTRRAAKMVCLDLDHPEIEDFIAWKVREERKARAMVAGSAILGDNGPIYSSEFEGIAINSVDGQNSNNSVRVTDKFMQAVEGDEDWHLINRTDGKIAKTIKARSLWEQICNAAYLSADPGIQFDDTINHWHTCAADGRIRASNPCSEYMFLDNTACNLASINLVKAFPIRRTQGFYDYFKHAIRIWTVILDISISMASFPSKEIAERSHNYRTLGLGYANLGALLMQWGVAYDSDAGRDFAANLTAIMHGMALCTSADLADELGAFPRFEANKDSVYSVIEKHYSLRPASYIEAEELLCFAKGKEQFRNAQVTLIAPTGTISFVMDCDTSGIEPEFALMKDKALAGGGNMSIINQSVPQALQALGYVTPQIEAIVAHIVATQTIEGAPNLKPEHLMVFDCANRPTNGQRFLRPAAHVLMMVAVQPFLSGAISKTCNLPSDATVEDVDHIYRMAHRLGLKSIAVYRDQSKMTQPLSNPVLSAEPKSGLTADRITEATIVRPATMDDLSVKAETTGRTGGLIPPTGARRSLPSRITGYRQKFRVDGHSLYLHTGLNDDGTLGEIFLSMASEGSTVRSLFESFAKSISLGLQYGVPVSEFVDAFVHTKFEPAGIVEGHDKIRLCSSVLDAVFRDLAITFLGRDDLANIKAMQAIEAAAAERMVMVVPAAHPSRPSGEICPQCHNATLERTGTCTTCRNCSFNSGCG